MGRSSTKSSHAPAAVKEVAPSKTSFLSRLSLPLLSRPARHIADFHIRPAEPHRHYAAGDHVAGAVVLTVVKPIRITHLTVSLHGFARVFKTPNGVNDTPINPTEIPSSTSKSKPRYLGNGFTRLFQDEQVLSADGKLEPRRYEFNFDLMFPPNSLPSSVDFERGTISYMITATLTRPTTISPTQSCERRVFLTEKLDVGVLEAPRPRTISLQPISKRAKKRRTHQPENTSPAPTRTDTITSEQESSRNNENSTEGSVAADDTQQDTRHISFPRSPIQCDLMSEISGESVASGSGSTGQSVRVQDASQTSSSGSQGASGKTQSNERRVIVATVELLRGGCLPGDIIPVKISVQHIKRIKSLHGVVVTLYRQGRIDSNPPIPTTGKLSNEDVKRMDKEYYYPRSKTGLGGLSLSSAGSCSVFRKDLVQTFQPLIIDPATLGATVTAYVRVPEDAFPTIKGLPGEMISFKYQIEVLVDLGGKLASQIQSVQSKSTPVSTPGLVGPIPRSPLESGGAFLSGSSIIDTDQLRRHKGVISVTFEAIVGTVNSNRNRNRGISRLSTYTRYIDETAHYSPSHGDQWHDNGEHERNHEETPYEYNDDYFPPANTQAEHEHPPYVPPEETRAPAPIYVPPPEVTEESGLSDKERVRRAEQRLLPSQPPEAPAVSSSRIPPEEENIYDADDAPTAPEENTATPQGPGEHLPGQDGPSAPNFEDLEATPTLHPMEDKQELERRRLIQEASAPPECPEDFDAGIGSSSSRPSAAPPVVPSSPDDEPSAPTLGEEDGYGNNYAYGQLEAGPSTAASGSGHAAGSHEPLPRYER